MKINFRIKKSTYQHKLRLSETGIMHYIVPVVVVVLVAIGGTYYLVASHADTTTGSTVSSGSGTGSGTGGSATGSYSASISNSSLAPAVPADSATAAGSATLASQTDSTQVGNVAAASASCAVQGDSGSTAKHLTGPYGGGYWLNPDRYGGGTQCPSNSDGKTDFTVYQGGVTQTERGNVQAFPDIIKGCSNVACVSSGFPARVSGLNPGYHASYTASGGAAAGKWDEIFDLWFNKYDVVGPSGGTEILIMFNQKNLPAPTGYYSKYVDVPVDGAYWTVYGRRASGNGHTWNFIEFRRNDPTNNASNLNIIHFMDDSEGADCASNTPCLNRSWYWTGLDTGFELWYEGYGLRDSGVSISP